LGGLNNAHLRTPGTAQVDRGIFERAQRPAASWEKHEVKLVACGQIVQRPIASLDQQFERGILARFT
jgi:hypothetical protein